MKQFDKVMATFRPAHTETLRNQVKPWIGWRGEWEAYWVIEEGEFLGQWAMVPGRNLPMTSAPWPGLWAPFGDLADVAPLDG